MKKIIIAFSIMLTCLIGFAQTNNFDWQIAKNKNGIKVYTREVKGKSIKEFKAICQVNTTIDKLVDLYFDVNKKTEWVFACKNSKILKEVNITNKYFYIESFAPWPVSNRDNIIHSVLSKSSDGKTILITEKGVPNYLNKKSNIVRIPEHNGFYRFTTLENGLVEIVFQCFSDPGGELPSFLINVSLVDNPFDTLTKIKEIVNN